MSEDLHDIDKLFQSAINEHEEMPTNKVWDNVENNLDKNVIEDYRKKNNSLKRLSILLLLLLLSSISIYVFVKPKISLNIASQNVEKPNNNITIKVSGKKDTSANNSTEQKVIEKSDLIKNIDNEKNKNPITVTSLSSSNIALENVEKSNHTITNKASSNKYMSAANSIEPKVNKKNNLIKNTDSKNYKRTVNVNYLPSNASTLATQQTISKKNLKSNNGNITSISKKDKRTTDKKVSVKITNGGSIEDIVEDTAVVISQKIIDKIDSVNALGKSIALDSSKTQVAIATDKITTEIKKPKTEKKKNETTKKRALFLSTFYSPDFAFYNLRDDDDNNLMPGANRDDIERNENHRLAYTTGLLLDYKINKHWGLQTGISFSKTTISITPRTIYAKAYYDGMVKYCYWASSGYAYLNTKNTPLLGDSINVSSATHMLQYIGIPLSIKYSFPFKKFELNVLAGISSNFLIKGEIETGLKERDEDEHDESKYELQGLKKTYFTGLVGIDAAYNLNSKWGITFSPTVRFALTSINKNIGVQSYSNSLGFATGLRFKF